MSKWDLNSNSAAFSDSFNYNAPYVMLLFEQSYDQKNKGYPKRLATSLTIIAETQKVVLFQYL